MLKKVIIVLAIALAIGGSAMAYAWWDNLSATQNETIVIGEGVTLQVAAVATAPAGKVLVPEGTVLKADDVTSIVQTYNVKLDLQVVDPLSLSVTASNVLIGGSATNAGLVGIAITQSASTVNDADVLVTVTVTLSEPADFATYTAIINQSITFDLAFEASQN
jgi:hypothetical protein